MSIDCLSNNSRSHLPHDVVYKKSLSLIFFFFLIFLILFFSFIFKMLNINKRNAIFCSSTLKKKKPIKNKKQFIIRKKWTLCSFHLPIYVEPVHKQYNGKSVKFDRNIQKYYSRTKIETTPAE